MELTYVHTGLPSCDCFEYVRTCVAMYMYMNMTHITYAFIVIEYHHFCHDD